MTEEYRKRLAAFLSEYIDIKDCRRGYGDDDVIERSIKMLITEGIFTVDELVKTALKDHAIIISKEFIRGCVYGKS